MRAQFYLLSLMFVVFTNGLFATQHTVTFDGTLTYTPSNLTVNVGDTVVWQGDFSSHPLQSGTIPSGAAGFSQSSGTTFSYEVTEAGTYNYFCTFHSGNNMAGVIIALGAPLSIVKEPTVAMQLTFTPKNIQINFATGSEDLLDVRVTNILGQPMWNERVPTKTSMYTIATDNLTAGVYVLSIADGRKTILTRKFMLQ